MKLWNYIYNFFSLIPVLFSCPKAEFGKTYRLTGNWSLPLHQQQELSLSWRKDNIGVSSCTFTTGCVDYRGDRYGSTIEAISDETFSSTITFKNVSVADEGEWTLTYVGMNSGSYDDIITCSLSVYESLQESLEMFLNGVSLNTSMITVEFNQSVELVCSLKQESAEVGYVISIQCENNLTDQYSHGNVCQKSSRNCTMTIYIGNSMHLKRCVCKSMHEAGIPSLDKSVVFHVTSKACILLYVSLLFLIILLC